MYCFEYSARVLKQLSKLDKASQRQIKRYIDKYLLQIDDPRRYGKPLTANKKGYWRYRVGDYRIICEIKDAELIILAVEVGHRKYIYK